jgi:hypothetical protein
VLDRAVANRNKRAATAASVLLSGNVVLTLLGHALDCTVADQKQTRKK